MTAHPLRSTGIFAQNQSGYIDALALTDKIIGDLRRSMEHAGTWDTTTMIFSADHPYRHRRLWMAIRCPGGSPFWSN